MKIGTRDILSIQSDSENIDYRVLNRPLFKEGNKTCIVVDDDPTGNQTVYNTPLLTNWDIGSIVEEFKKETPLLFLLTNSRSLEESEASSIYKTISNNVYQASLLTNRAYVFISRSDSTLRGHFPSDIDNLTAVGNLDDALIVFIMVMFEGGRITFNDIHYIQESDELVPVNESAFSKDTSFGYGHANLRDWIIEKSGQTISPSQISSISINELRTANVDSLVEHVTQFNSNQYCIFNAINYFDLDKICNLLHRLEKNGKKIIYRTSSSFVSSYSGLPQKALLSGKEICQNSENGGLTIVGSYVKKTSDQLNFVLNTSQNLNVFELDVEKLFGDHKIDYLKKKMSDIDQSIAAGLDVILYTSRKLIQGVDMKENLNINTRISAGIAELVKGIKNRPKYLIAKGGITSHDIAIKGLGMKRSVVKGQILPGVPVWEMGHESKFPKLPYIVFPGNVGDKEGIYKVIQKLTKHG